MSKVEAVCPHCHKANALEVTSLTKVVGLQDIQCSHCSKHWHEDLSVTNRLIKSAPVPSTELSALIVQVRGQIDELAKKIGDLAERRTAAAAQSARFNTSGVEKSDVVAQELNKALANGKPVGVEAPESGSPRFQTVASIGSAQRVRSGQPFDVGGVEKSDVADHELRKALGNGKPVGFSLREN